MQHVLYYTSNHINQLPQVSVPNIPAISTCIMLSNMFDPTSENEPGWDKDIHDDVLEECMRHGPVMHIYVDPFSQVSLKTWLAQGVGELLSNMFDLQIRVVYQTLSSPFSG